MNEERFNELSVSLAEHTYCRPSKLRSLVKIANRVEEFGVPGDYVECGTYKGGSAALLGATMGAGRHLWLFDSFAGMPATSEIDGEEAGQWVGDCVASQEDVEKALAITGVAKERRTIRAGWFSDSLIDPLPERIALLHVDADWHDSVMTVLERLFPRVSEGGAVVLDDFGHWEGCREAFYDFCAKYRIRPLLERFENDQAFWFKGRAHNRDGWHPAR